MQINLFYLRITFKIHKIIGLTSLFVIVCLSIKSQQIELINPTFLGNEQRNYYGNNSPDSLNIIWKHYLGKGKTTISRNLGERLWAGAGWTGQPLLYKEDDSLYLIQGAYDHHLKKINARNGKLIWQYKFDDVVKGTGTIWHNKKAKSKKHKLIIFQGSRLGYGKYLDTKHVPSYRAISLYDGSELWRLDVRMTDSYSRDVDGSCLVINDTLYIGLENGMLTIMDPDPNHVISKDEMLQPPIIKEHQLYTKSDISAHRKNLVTESSPSKLNNHLYIASGSGHVYGYDMLNDTLDWEFFVGSDIDGSAIVTSDSCIIATIEKQYIIGKGGVFKFNPKFKNNQSVLWYFPVEDSETGSWEGGIIGSASISDYHQKKDKTKLAAFVSIKGNLYLVDHQKINRDITNLGPNQKFKYPSPILYDKKFIGPSISTPLIIKDKLVVAGYHGLKLYKIEKDYSLTLLDSFEAEFEATPFVYNERIYIASRNGYLYCFGN